MPASQSYAEPGPLGAYSDAARRISDNYNLHLTADPDGSPQHWMAFRLDNGECDPTLYDSKSDAIRAKGLFAKHWGYAIILETGMSPKQAESYLRTCRQVADNPKLKWLGADAEAPANMTDTLILPFRGEGNTGRLPLL